MTQDDHGGLPVPPDVAELFLKWKEDGFPPIECRFSIPPGFMDSDLTLEEVARRRGIEAPPEAVLEALRRQANDSG